MSREPKVEIIQHKKVGEYYTTQLAIDGVLAIPQEIHASILEHFQSEKSFWEYLIRSAQTLIQVFGDARENRVIHPEEVAA